MDTNNDNEEEDPNSLASNKKRQLSITSTSDINVKRTKLTTIDAAAAAAASDQTHDQCKEKDVIPPYLSLNNESFNNLLRNMHGSVNSISIHDFQYMALCIHRIAALRIQKQVTIVYFKSGTGTLRDPELELVPVDRRVWPAQVKAEMSTRRAMTNTTMPPEVNVDDEQHAYENLVRERFEEITSQIDQYEQHLDEKKKQLGDLTVAMEQTIRNYVHQHGIYPLKLRRDLKITLLKYDFDAEIMERQFLQEKPTEYQVSKTFILLCLFFSILIQLQTAKRLFEARNELEKTKRDLLELKQRVFYNKPPLAAKSIQTSIEILSTGDNDNQQLLNKKEIFIRQKLFDYMGRQVMKVERKLHSSKKTFDDELSTMWNNHRQLVKGKDMPTALNNLIERRLTNIVDRWRDIYLFRVLYHVQAPYGDSEALEKMKANNNNSPVNDQQSIKKTEFQPRTIIDTKHSLTDLQLQLISRGPTYVPPCQMHVLSSSSSSSSSSSMDEILKKQYAPLKHQLAASFSKYAVNVALQFNIQNQVYDEFLKVFSVSLPASIHQRAQNEHVLVGTIRQSLKENNLILRRTADNMNTFYLGNRTDFERKADNYIRNTNQYEVIYTIANQDNNRQAFRSEMSKSFDYIKNALNILKRRKDIDDTLYKRLQTDDTQVKFSYLYFLPDVSQVRPYLFFLPFFLPTSNSCISRKILWN